MTPDDLRHLSAEQANTLPPLLQAMWHAAHDRWDAAHTLAQDVPSAAGASVHAYLHRQEGDLGNAGYWYRRAGAPVFQGSLESEWHSLAKALLDTRVS